MTELPTPVGMMSVTYGFDRKVRLPVYGEKQMQEYAQMEVLAEREAIAKMVECLFDDPNDSVLAFIVDAIRARGQE